MIATSSAETERTVPSYDGAEPARQGRVAELWPGIVDRLALDRSGELGDRDHGAGERDRADQGGGDDRDGEGAVQAAGLGGQVVERRKRDECRRSAADAVE